MAKRDFSPTCTIGGSVSTGSRSAEQELSVAVARSGRLIVAEGGLARPYGAVRGIRGGAAWLELHDSAAVFVYNSYLLVPAARKRIAKASPSATAAISAKEHGHPNFASHRGSPKDTRKVMLWRRASPRGSKRIFLNSVRGAGRWP